MMYSNLINSEFKLKIDELVANLLSECIYVQPYHWIRSPIQQATFYKRGKLDTVIKKKVDQLNTLGCDYLAEVLKTAPRDKETRWATDAIPGLSWHQWGLAVDLFIKSPVDGSAIWDSNDPRYKRMGEVANSLGLESGYFWNKRDAVHIQLNSKKVDEVYSLKEINQQMKQWYAEKT